MDIISPLHPKNPISTIGENGKGSTEKKRHYEGYQNVPLPSKGYFYTGQYRNMETLKLKQMDWTDDDILTTTSFWEDNTIFIELLKNAIIDENGFNANNLVPVDRDMLLLWLRSTSLGNEFKVNYYCPACGNGALIKGDTKDKKQAYPGEIIWKINELQLPEYNEKYIKELEEFGEVTIKTILSDLKVKVTVPSLAVALRLEKNLLKKKQDLKLDKSFNSTTTLLAVTNGIELEDGKVIRAKDEISKYFTDINLPLVDSRQIIRTASELNIKFDTKKDFVCKTKNCGHVEEGVELPLLHKNFFWPES